MPMDTHAVCKSKIAALVVWVHRVPSFGRVRPEPETRESGVHGIGLGELVV